MWYRASFREYPEHLREPEYTDHWEKKRVVSGGQFRWRGVQVFAAHALEDEVIGVEPLEDCWRVWFCFYEVGILDRQGKIWRPDLWAKKQPKGGDQ